jgi:hypothetical protein
MAGKRRQISTGNLSLLGVGKDATPTGARIEDAERALLELADFVYAHTSLKPMSKTLFFLSRTLLTAALDQDVFDGASLPASYLRVREGLGDAAPDDDFDFGAVAAECGQHLPRALEAVRTVLSLTAGTDRLGLAFNTLLRGKWESGEGLGTYLTPEEVVQPMVRMLVDAVGRDALRRLGPEGLFFGDICGGSGRFVFALAQELMKRGVGLDEVEYGARLFDQSSLAVGFARVNFALDGLRPRFARVGDSLLAREVSELAGRFLLLATNPPFGAGKYQHSLLLRAELPSGMLEFIGLRASGDAADPSELFLFRNLALLAPGGALAIVLPDGVVQSQRFLRALEYFESAAGVALNVVAAVSLPVATFSLGGTVAKTSFLVIRREEKPTAAALYAAIANHVGFLKRGNRRAPDPKGNDLPAIAADFESDAPSLGARVPAWREHERLVVPQLLQMRADAGSGRKLRELVDAVRGPIIRRQGAEEKGRRLHVSVLDIDETGLIDVVSASRNQPVTPPLVCQPRDILISCINPRIWRVAVVPKMEGVVWTCSTELLVLRPKGGHDPWPIALGLHHGTVIAAVQSMAGGTSSSRQRVEKERVLDVEVPIHPDGSTDVRDHAAFREVWYATRLRESDAYDRLHDGEEDFAVS